MTPERMRAIAQRCVEDMGVTGDIIDGGIDLTTGTDFVAAAIETALEEAGRPVGVDLRDRFAMAALPAAALGGWPGDDQEAGSPAAWARSAYALADAMLAARKEKP